MEAALACGWLVASGVSIGGRKMGVVRVFRDAGLSYIVCVVCRDVGHGSGLGEV